MKDARDLWRAHWEGVYGAKPFTEVSWYQAVPDVSLRQILATGIGRNDPLIDVGGGASTLVDHLLDLGFLDISVLDISRKAIEQAKGRLGGAADNVSWIVADVTAFSPGQEYRVWHDRAVLHFLTAVEDRQRYVEALRRSLPPGGHVILATFGPEGPLKCSGLEVRRYTIEMMADLLGAEFELQEHVLEDHRTPWGAAQQFLHSTWTRMGP